METFKFPFYYTDGILLSIGTIENSHKNSTHTASDPATSLDMQSVSNKTHPYRDLALWLVLSWGTWAGLSLSRHKKILIIIISVIISTPASPLPCYQKEEEPCADGTVGLHEQDGAVCVCTAFALEIKQQLQQGHPGKGPQVPKEKFRETFLY